MLVISSELTFAKQPVIERSTGDLVGYSGVAWIDLEGRRHLKYGYRLGFAFCKHANVLGCRRRIYQRRIHPLVALQH